LKSQNLPIQRISSTCWGQEDTYLYLGSVTPNIISGLAVSSSPLSLSRVMGNELFDFIDFFAPNFFIFSSEFLFPKKQFETKKSSVILLKKDEILIILTENYRFSEEKNYKKGNFNSIDSEKLCPLRHLLLLSRTLNEDQLNSFLLAIKHGFPIDNIVDFEKKQIKIKRDIIISQWDQMISSQKGTTEEDFVLTLKSALKNFRNEYFQLFKKIDSIYPFKSSSRYSLSPLFALLQFSNMESKTAMTQPKIGIKSLRFEAILKLEEEDITKFMENLNEELFSDSIKVDVGIMGKKREKRSKNSEKKLYRVRIFISLKTASDLINLEDSTAIAKDLAWLVVEKILYKISVESWEKIKKCKKPEFWLKSADIAVEVPSFMVDETKKIIRDEFSCHFGSSRDIKLYQKSGNKIEMSFNLYFSSTHDYAVDGRDEGFFLRLYAKDPYTRVGIEHLMRKEFGESFESFKKAKIGLIRDYVEVSPELNLNKSDISKLIDELENHISLYNISVRDILFSQIYTKESDASEILDMLNTADKWFKTAMMYFEINLLEREIRYQGLPREEYSSIKKRLKKLFMEADFKFFRNFYNFIEDLGSFYVILLQETEKKAPESVKEWMKLTI
jgi:hypothetical protein